MYQDLEPTDEARTLAAELFDSIALRPDGRPFDFRNPEEAEEALSAAAQVIALGPVRFKIVDADASALAVAAGVIEPGDPALAIRVTFEQAGNAPPPNLGQHIVLPTENPEVSILFLVALTHADIDAEPDLGPEVERNADLDMLQAGEGLLVQVFDPAAA